MWSSWNTDLKRLRVRVCLKGKLLEALLLWQVRTRIVCFPGCGNQLAVCTCVQLFAGVHECGVQQSVRVYVG